MSDLSMKAFDLAELAAAQQRAYHEFLRVPSMSLGLYQLKAGGVDGQSPHTEDEAYYVVSGRATIEVEGEDRPVRAGALIYVPAHARHRFKDIIEDLTLLVFFAPAEYSNKAT
jgi:mannose-6-phosphate isomerase-like protein (cupin superfamily)